MVLVSVIVYLVIQRESMGGVHVRTAEVRDLAENSALTGEEGEPEIGWEVCMNLASYHNDAVETCYTMHITYLYMCTFDKYGNSSELFEQ